MEIHFDKNMNVIRNFRPLIDQEGRTFAIYNPEGGPNYGLYTPRFYAGCPSDEGLKKNIVFKSHQRVYR